MATIYSNRNDNTGTHTTVSPNSTTTWAGAVVPLATDQVYIVGRRTQINQAGFAKWVSTRTITVDSTTYFATVGFFYSVTDRGQIVKINYTGLTATTFTGCSVDETDPYYAWSDGGTIPDNMYVHNPAYVITINVGETFECNELIIAEGGWLLVNGGTLKINQGIYLRDGRLVGRGSGSIIISRNSAALAAIGYLTTENYSLSVLDIDGEELRTYATTTAIANKNDVSVNVTGLTNGSFAVNDEVTLYLENDYRRRDKNYVGYRDATASFKNMDEGFDVCGVSGNDIYLALRNGARGPIKAVNTVTTQKVLDVNPDSLYFNAGDVVVINNKKYTIDKVEDSEVLIKTYDFTNPATSLTDFWVDDPTNIYSGGWVIESGVGLKNATTSYRELVNKYIWSREIIVEAEMSPLSAYSSGTRGTTDYGLITSYDPAYRWGHRGYDLFKSDYLVVDDADNRLNFYLRAMTNYPYNRLDRDASFRTSLQQPALYRVDNRKNETIIHINGDHITTEHRRDGAFKGLVGLFVENNPNFRCKSLTIKQPTQKIYITTTDAFSIDQKVYRSGIEWDHPAGSRLLKIASVNTGTGNHKDLAFAYSGQNGSGEWPLIMQVNGANATNASLPYVHNHDMNLDYYYDLGNAPIAKSVTIDLMTVKTFSHVSFAPRFIDYGTYYGMNGVAVYGSNDRTNWTTLYGPTDDTKKWYYGNSNRLAFYPTGTVSYRYVKFETKGAQHATYFTNRYVQVGVHDFSTGYKIGVNNAGDLNIGDKITISTDSGYSLGTRELDAYYSWTAAAQDPETYWHGGWALECTIIGKAGNILTLDKPIFWGFIEDSDSVTVIKTNRNFTIAGTMGPTTSTNDWRWPNLTYNGGSAVGRLHLLRNVRLNYIGSYRYTSSTSHNRGFRIYAYDYYNATLNDGCVHMFGPDGTTWSGNGYYSAHGIARNNVVISQYTAYWMYYTVSCTGAALFNNKIINCAYGVYNEAMKLYTINYNEISQCTTGIVITASRVDRHVMPHMNEIRRNYIKGSSTSAFSINNETVGPRRIARIKIEHNKARGMDDYVTSGTSFSGSPYMESDFMSEHTGSRMSRYRNEGIFTQGDTSSDLSFQTPQHNISRFGYDLTFGLYHTLKRSYDNPEVLRIYTINGDDYYAILGVELDVLEDSVPFQIYVQFDYRYPQMARLQDDGNADGALRCYSLQHGTKLQDVYSPAPASLISNDWNTFSYTFNTFAAEEGKAAVYLTRDAYNSYIEIKNSFAYILTDQGQKIRVIGNTFMLDNVWDQFREVRDVRPLTTGGTPTLKLTKIKF